MSVSSEITRISNNVANSYSAVAEKGGTVPASATSGNLAGAIRSIPMNFVPKTTYEYNMELALGGTGKVCIGKFPMYDSNVTVEINSTTSSPYHGVLIIATQNINTTGGGTYTAKVYGDADNSLTESIRIHYGSGSNVFSVYINLPGWSKNLLHIQCAALQGTPTDIATTISEIPSNATIIPTNALKAQLDGKAAASHTHSYLPLSGGTVTGNVTLDNSSSAQSGEPQLVWGTRSSNTPFIGFATDQSDGTFVVSSLKGTNYASGLAIGGGSGNLLWKGTKVATTSDIPTLSSLGVTATAAELNYVDGVTSSVQTQLNAKMPTANRLRFTNTTVATSAWASNATYSAYPYRAAVTLSGVTASHDPDVTFSVADATSGNFAPVADSYAGGIYIYAATKPTATVTIPTIVCFKG